MILMYSHLIIADWELTLWYRKQLWGTFHYAIRVLFCKISQFLYCFAKFKFFEKVLADGTIEQGTVFWGAIDPRWSQNSLATCNDILNYNAMQCKSHLFLSNPKYSAHRWNNKGAAFYSAACPDPAKASPNKRVAQYRGRSAACHLSKSSSSILCAISLKSSSSVSSL